MTRPSFIVLDSILSKKLWFTVSNKVYAYSIFVAFACITAHLEQCYMRTTSGRNPKLLGLNWRS